MKRFLSMVLTLCMIMGLVSVMGVANVSAEEEPAPAIMKNNLDGTVWDFSESANVDDYGVVGKHTDATDTSGVTIVGNGVSGQEDDKCLKIYRMNTTNNKNISFLDHNSSDIQASVIKVKYSFNISKKDAYLRFVLRNGATDFEVVQYSAGMVKLFTPTATTNNSDKVEAICNFDANTWYDNEITVDLTKKYINYKIKKSSESTWKEYDVLNVRYDYAYTERIGLGFGPGSAADSYMLIDDYSQQSIKTVTPTLKSYNDAFDANTQFTQDSASRNSDKMAILFRKGWFNGNANNTYAKIENLSNGKSVLSVGGSAAAEEITKPEANKVLYFKKNPTSLMYKFQCEVGGPVDNGYKMLTLTLGMNETSTLTNNTAATKHINLVQIHNGKVSLLTDFETDNADGLPLEDVIEDFGTVDANKLYKVEAYYIQSAKKLAVVITNGEGKQFTKVRTFTMADAYAYPCAVRMRNVIPQGKTSVAYFDNFQMDLVQNESQGLPATNIKLLSGDTQSANFDESVELTYLAYIDTSALDKMELDLKINGVEAVEGEDYTYTAGGKKLTFNFNDLPKGAKVVLNINWVKGILNGTQTTAREVSFTVSDKEVVTKNSTFADGKLKTNITSYLKKGVPVTVIAGIFSSDGRCLEAVKPQVVTVTNRNQEVVIDLSEFNTEGKIVKGFVWDTLTNKTPVDIVE